jgi:hypothetical protein
VPELPSLGLEPRTRLAVGALGLLASLGLFFLAAALGLPGAVAALALTLFMVSGIDLVLTRDSLKAPARK